jgi:fermentation-respiration switch protein FrsA (DUF1100 family)
MIRRSLPIILLLLTANCGPLVNHFAFFPNRRDAGPLTNLQMGMRELFVPTDDGERLQGVLLTDSASPKLILYFHGNAGNISCRVRELLTLRQTGASVLGISYRGFGKSSGRPSEQGIYRDGAAAYRYAVDTLHFSPDHIYVVGRSIGTTVAITTAINHPIAGLVLVTPLTTGKAYGKAHGLGPIAFLTGNAFNNLGKCGRITVPVLVIHGTKDEVIPYSMGKTIYNQIRTKKTFVTIQDGYHNDLEFVDSVSYWSALSAFVNAAN